jgi:hypothetical protein
MTTKQTTINEAPAEAQVPYDEQFNYHNNAAALVITAAAQSGLLRDVANALHFSDTNPGGGCLACGVLEELVEEFGEHCGLPGYDFYAEGFCVTDYSDEELRSYLRVPFALPRTIGSEMKGTDAKIVAAKILREEPSEVK